MATKSDHIAFAKRLVTVLDLQFSVLGIKFGIDPLFDAIPIVGNNVSTAAALYLFYIAYICKVPKRVYGRMLWNIFLDYVIGSIPILGFIGDALYKSNARNWSLIAKYADGDVLEGEVISEK